MIIMVIPITHNMKDLFMKGLSYTINVLGNNIVKCFIQEIDKLDDMRMLSAVLNIERYAISPFNVV